MDTVIIVVVFECFQFLTQVMAIPEKNSVQILPANGADEPLDKRMRDGHKRHGVDGLDFQNAQIGRASAAAYILFSIILVVSLVIIVSLNRRAVRA